jgi:hypothetical protein
MVVYETDDANRTNPVLFCPSGKVVERVGIEFDRSKAQFACCVIQRHSVATWRRSLQALTHVC